MDASLVNTFPRTWRPIVPVRNTSRSQNIPKITAAALKLNLQRLLQIDLLPHLHNITLIKPQQKSIKYFTNKTADKRIKFRVIQRKNF